MSHQITAGDVACHDYSVTLFTLLKDGHYFIGEVVIQSPSNDQQEIFERAAQRFKETSYPDKNPADWRLVRYSLETRQAS